MAKKKQGNVIPLLSPENYIRQKARTLPLYECWINKGWQEGNMAHVVVTRQHITGNLTLGMYMVDLNCLGIKDAHHLFNIFGHEYKKIIEDMKKQVGLIQVPYPLVHNIIYAALEFAEDSGFKPHQDFSVARFILEEDNDDIELMDIECGQNGKPTYFRGPNDSDAFANRVLKTLESNVGKGNYFYVDGSEMEVDEDEDDESLEEFDQRMDEFYQELFERYRDYSLHDKVEQIKNMAERQDKLTFDENEEYLYLRESVIEELQDFDLIDELHDNISSQLDAFEISNHLTDEMLGIEPGSNMKKNKFKKHFLQVYDAINSLSELPEKQLTDLHKEVPDNPAVHYLEIHYLQKIQSDDFLEVLDNYYQKFPDYPLIKMLWYVYRYYLKNEGNSWRLEELLPGVFFHNQTINRKLELLHYLEMLTLIAVAGQDMNELAVVEMLIEDLLDNDGADALLLKFIDDARLKIIISLNE